MYFDIEIVLNIITKRYIIPKYTIVFIIADCENINLYSVISASNIFATTTDISWEAKIPIINPIPNEIIPIINVSIKSIFEIFPFPIPSVIYIPNSFFLLLIKKLFAYTIKNPSIKDTKTETPAKVVSISFIISLVEFEISSIACWESIELNI